MILKGTEVFSLYYKSNGYLSAAFSDATIDTFSQMPINTWTLVTVYLFAFDLGHTIAGGGLISLDTTLVSVASAYRGFGTLATGLQREDSSDIFKIGGFVGSLSNVIVVYGGGPQIMDGKALLFQICLLSRIVYVRLSICKRAYQSYLHIKRMRNWLLY